MSEPLVRLGDVARLISGPPHTEPSFMPGMGDVSEQAISIDHMFILDIIERVSDV
ncbi:hypothetical protein KIN20_033138 [Parelaphostrongylus tenuis]|uniref:Uncharacterized protein n=1 Tax=Parelaphostrongylus tenuis TaxID=148309 RepID=A0AAD5WI64_PARTN|nr:hypothetical protein KIN20_033138 [Parelaphostrongylus tenuis]